ncbi:MAG: type 3 protein poly-gamma-glutamate synthesis protein [Candidatus Adlerbacteria bacterium]|nr:type 3 protein poly-gamma-glutamate synthesis protein [Candidatus Adlerbacteria bacterium]
MKRRHIHWAAIIITLVCVLALSWPHSTSSIRHFGGPLALVSQPDMAVVMFAGDVMLDRSLRSVARERGGDFLFECMDSTLRTADAVVANLEGPITDNVSRSEGSAPGSSDNFVFTFPPTTAQLLKDHYITAVSLGNNHIENFGSEGVQSTISYLNEARVGYFGDPLHDTVATLTSHGIVIELIGYNEFDNKAGSASTTLSQIRGARARGHLPVVFTHWGIEYEPTAPQYIRELAHQFADAGAAMVIGSHPHVVEDHETYNGVPIYYSLGNFIFDQYFSDAVTHGLLLKVTFDSMGAQTIEEIPVVLDRSRQTCPVQF